MNKPIRVLIAEDMQSTYQLLRQIIESSDTFAIVGWASDGEEAVLQAEDLHPDIITMDIQMPKRSGLDAIERIMSVCPTPILVISTLTESQTGSTAFDALEKGALDIMGKPWIADPDFDHYCDSLRTNLRALSEVKVVRRRRHKTNDGKTAGKEAQSVTIGIPSKHGCELVVLGASAGGPEALHTIFADLPGDYPRPLVVVQHIVAGFVGGLVSWLDQHCPMKVKLAEDQEILQPGVIYFSPDNRHLLIGRSRGKLIAALEDGPPMGGFKPSIDKLMLSAADTCGASAIGGILTGMGSDGAMGLKHLRDQGGNTFVQDEASCLVFGMPKMALKAGAAKEAIPLQAISRYVK